MRLDNKLHNNIEVHGYIKIPTIVLEKEIYGKK
jgi:hypothetical protein